MIDPLDSLRAALQERYAVERLIGQGGMATVYLAMDTRHDRRVAIKVLRPELAASLGSDRFLREIKVAAKLQHPNILGLRITRAGTYRLTFSAPGAVSATSGTFTVTQN